MTQALVRYRRRAGAVRLFGLGPVEWLARAGYAARGVVYLAVGWAAIEAALELRKRPFGLEEAVASFIAWPLGPVWLTILAVGLSGFVLWRLVQAVFDADHQGWSAKARLNRFGQLVSATIYTAVTLSCLGALEGLDEAAEEPSAARQAMDSALQLPLGELALIGVGASVLLAGVLNVLHGFRGGFGRHLLCVTAIKRWAVPFARIGYASRGVVFLAVGVFFVEAALDLAPLEAATLGGALQVIEDQPFGSSLLILAGLGLLAFGAFGLVEAWYRRIVVPEQLDPD
jgi:uncharacterized protein YjeT (DUF2065 family)